MTFNKFEDAVNFMDAIKECKGNVYLKSNEGDVINLKSQLSGLIGLAEILNGHGYMFDLVCDNREDELVLTKMFQKNPEMV